MIGAPKMARAPHHIAPNQERLFQCRAHGQVFGIEVSTEAINGGHDGNENTTRNERILD